MPPKSDRIDIARRFCVPPDTGIGGYVALAARLDGPAEIALRARPPFEIALDVVGDGEDGVSLTHGHPTGRNGATLASATSPGRNP
ncbi:MAG: hypothetical protein U1E87_03585 [Alphaproteobacteria bacterium]